ncbi:MAG: ATP-binding cassette domain-containing protein [Acidobacteria bacterium]|nr:ATP-binding cassette domain-containing protein [Acidobacteriota bacterium]
MDAPIALCDVWKSYGKPPRAQPAVSALTLNVTAGSVYGFLGPNGAGKSTTIRMILGLQRPDHGTVHLFGLPLQSAREALLCRIGSLVEAPSLYLHLTGRQNLEVHRRLLAAPKRAIDEALDTVGLLAVGHRVVRDYSSGMKQRLGLALALLGKPELLILDEPTNGLDPAGIHEVRALIRELPGRARATVFLSSHLLAEVEQVATHLAILSQGRLRFEGTLRELHLRGGRTIVAAVDRPDRARAVLEREGYNVTCEPDRILVSSEGAVEPARINALLVHAGIAVSHLAAERPTLEDRFLELTSPLAARTEVAPQ